MNLKNPIGERLDLWEKKRELIGIVDNVLMGDPTKPVKPMFMILNPVWINAVTIRLVQTNDLSGAIKKVEEIFKKYNSAYPFQYAFADVEFQKKFTEGPVGLLYLRVPGMPSMGKSLAQWFVFNLFITFSVAYLTSRTAEVGTYYLQVFRIAGTIAFLAYAMGGVPNSIFMGKPWRVTIKEMLDGLIYALLIAGTFGWLWPR